MPEQKILIITYYWPPSGGSGVQRWLKFVKYLPQFGWKPIVFTPQNPAMVQQDESLLKDVPAEADIIRFPIWEPYDAFFKLSSFLNSGDKTVKPSQLTVKRGRSLFQKMANWVRGNFFIPDPKVFWVKPSVAFLDGYLKEKGINTIVTTGPPHSMHLIGYRLKRKNPSLNWIADFRDPWSEWPFLSSFNLTDIVRGFHKKLEKKILTTASHVITITPFYQRRFEELSGRSVTMITNGFDEDDFKYINYQKPVKFTIRHVGIVYEMANPGPLIETITMLSTELNGFKENSVVEFIGEVNATFRNAIEKSPIGPMVTFKNPVPHKDLLNMYGTTSVLLLNIEGYQHAEGLMPGKLFEYLATGLPILGFGPSVGDASTVLQNAGSGKVFEKNNIREAKAFLEKSFQAWQTSSTRLLGENNATYSRRMLTENLTTLLR